MRLAGIASLSQQENVSSIELLESKLLLWQQAIKLLKNIPQESSFNMKNKTKEPHGKEGSSVKVPQVS